MSIAVVTYLYPQGLKYTGRFLQTLQQQSLQDFKLIVFNDGVTDVQDLFKDLKQQIEIVDVTGSPTQIRFTSFEYLRQTIFDKIIFQDIDDEMSENRIEVISGLLEKYDVVSNDLTLVNDKGEVFDRSIWRERLGDTFVFDHEFIEDKNIVGIGNSGIRRTLLDTVISFSDHTLVADWFIFYQYLFLTKMKALFTAECQTLYRQHEANMAGIKEPDRKRIEYVLAVKEAHFRGLIDAGYPVEKKLADLLTLKNSDYRIRDEIKKDKLFWWEETRYLESIAL